MFENTVIFGFGQTGQACLTFLMHAYPNHSFLIVDSRLAPKNIDLALKQGHQFFYLDENCSDSQEELKKILDKKINQTPTPTPTPISIPISIPVLISPGISPFLPIASQGFPAVIQWLKNNKENSIIFGELSFFLYHLKAAVKQPKIIAVTGTNGKTTVTALTTHILKSFGIQAVAAGNIGLNMIELLKRKELPEVIVLELSSFQLEYFVTYPFVSAVVINITEDHLDWHPDFEHYRKSKEKILQHSQTYAINLAVGEQKIVFFQHLLIQDIKVYLEKNKTELKIKGQHNLENIYTSILLVYEGFKDFFDAIPRHKMIEKLATAIANYEGEPHRTTFIKNIDGVDFYDDSKGTNVGATLAALNSFEKPCHLILGGDSKGQDLTILGLALKKKLEQNSLRQVFILGKDKDLFIDVCKLNAIPYTVLPHTMVTKESVFRDILLVLQLQMTQKIDKTQKLQQGDMVLLSPACASWDMFCDYKERGLFFQNAVHEILKLC